MQLLVAGALALVVAGCVNTVGGGKKAGWPIGEDTVENRYERSVDQAFEAAKEVVRTDGVLNTESILHSETNAVKTVQGKINQRNVWVRVESLNPQVISVKVQTRTEAGGSDISLAHEVATQIAVKLATK